MGTVSKYELSDRELRALDAASIAMNGEPDSLALMNSLCNWPDPPPSDERWERKVGAGCEIAVAFCKQAQNYKDQVAALTAENEKLRAERDALQGALREAVSRIGALGRHGRGGVNITDGIPSEVFVAIGRDRFADEYEVARATAESVRSEISDCLAAALTGAKP